MDLPSLKVMTLNLHRGMDEYGTHQLAGDLALFNTERPDLIALQEVESRQLKTFKPAGYQVIFGPNLNFIPFRFGNAILTRGRLLYHRHHYLPSQLEPRGLDEIALEIAGHKVTILNTHLGLQRNERSLQFAEIYRIISYLSGPVILLGDFNAEPGDVLFTGIRSGFFKEIGAGAPEAKTFPASKPATRFDHIWYNDYFQPLRGNVLPWLGSDHLPVVAELKLVKGNPTSRVEPFIPILPQNNTASSALSATLVELDSPEIQLGIEAKSESEFNDAHPRESFAELLFPLNPHWIIGAEYRMGGVEFLDAGVTVFRIGYTSGSFDLRDYFSLLRIKGYGRWIFYACSNTEEAVWMEWNQVYRWSSLWETELTFAFKAENIWRLEQNLYLSDHLNFSLGIDTDNQLSTHITIILQ